LEKLPEDVKKFSRILRELSLTKKDLSKAFALRTNFFSLLTSGEKDEDIDEKKLKELSSHIVNEMSIAFFDKELEERKDMAFIENFLSK
jgi:hypothetical protein